MGVLLFITNPSVAQLSLCKYSNFWKAPKDGDWLSEETTMWLEV